MRTGWLAGMLLLSAAAATPAADSPLAQVPADATVVLHVKGVARTRKWVTDTVKAIMPPREGQQMAAQLDKGFKDLLGDRRLDGLPDDGPVFLALLKLPDVEKPDELRQHLAVVARVTDYKSFRDGLLTEDERDKLSREKDGYESAPVAGQRLYFVNRGDYVTITPDEDAARAVAAGQRGLDTRLNKDVAADLLDADVSLYADLAAINKEYGEQLLAFRQSLQQGLEGQAEGFGLDKAAVDALKEMFRLAFQLFRDSRALLVGVHLEKEGFLVRAELGVGADTKTNALLKATKSGAMKEMEALPAAANRAFQASYPVEGLEASVIRLLAGDLSSVQGKALKEAADLEKESGAGLSLEMGRNRGQSQSLTVVQCADPEKAVKAEILTIKASEPGGGLLGTLVKERPELEENAKTYRGFRLHRARLEPDVEKLARMLNRDPEEYAKTEAGQPVEYWFGTDGKVMAIVGGHDWDDAQKRLDEYLDGSKPLGERKAFRAAREKIPPEVTVLYVEETTLYSQAMLDMLPNQLPGVKVPQLPRPAAGKEAYGAYSLTLRDGRVSADAWFPNRTWADYFKAALPLYR